MKLKILYESAQQVMVFSGISDLQTKRDQDSWWSKALDSATNYASNRSNALGGNPLILATFIDMNMKWEPDPDEWYYPRSETEKLKFDDLSYEEKSLWFNKLQNFHILESVNIIGIWKGANGHPSAPQLTGNNATQWLDTSNNWQRLNA